MRSSARSWPTSISTTSTIYGPTSGGSDAPRATLLSCAMRTTPSSALSISTRQSGSLPISRQGSHASGSPFIPTRRGSSSLADPQLRIGMLGLGKPKSFDFLGFTHFCATRRSGLGFVLGRKPVAKRMRAKLREIKEQLMAIRHEGTERQGRWLRQVLRGWMAYYAVPMSGQRSAFRHHMIERWHGALMRRSQRRRLTWMRMKKIADRHLPFPRFCTRGPKSGFSSPSKVEARCVSSARRDSARGAERNLRPYRDRLHL